MVRVHAPLHLDVAYPALRHTGVIGEAAETFPDYGLEIGTLKWARWEG